MLPTSLIAAVMAKAISKAVGDIETQLKKAGIGREVLESDVKFHARRPCSLGSNDVPFLASDNACALKFLAGGGLRPTRAPRAYCARAK